MTPFEKGFRHEYRIVLFFDQGLILQA